MGDRRLWAYSFRGGGRNKTFPTVRTLERPKNISRLSERKGSRIYRLKFPDRLPTCAALIVEGERNHLTRNVNDLELCAYLPYLLLSRHLFSGIGLVDVWAYNTLLVTPRRKNHKNPLGKYLNRANGVSISWALPQVV